MTHKETYTDANGRERLIYAAEIKACVGITTCPLRALVFVSRCPIGTAYCIDHDSEKGSLIVCKHFWEVETMDYLPVVKCDHPKARSDPE